MSGKTSPFVNRSKSAKKRRLPRRFEAIEESQNPGRSALDWLSKGNAASLRIFEEFGVSDFSRYQILAKYTAHHNTKILDKAHNQIQKEYD